MKVRKSILKRFKRRSSGVLSFEHNRSNRNHNLRKKSRRRLRALKLSSSIKAGAFRYKKLIS